MSAPPSQAGYAVNLGTQPYGAATFAPAFVSLWFDSSDAAVPGGTPRPASTEYPMPVSSTPAANSPGTSPGTPSYVSDSQSMAFQGVVVITPGTATVALRSLGFICTAAGNITLTLADGSTITLGITASASFQSLPFAVTNVALGTGTAGTFWNLK